jgi:hypothetical protein
VAERDLALGERPGLVGSDRAGVGGDLTYLPPADGEGPRFVVSLAAG